MWTATYMGVHVDDSKNEIVTRGFDLLEGTLPPEESTFSGSVFKRVGFDVAARKVSYVNAAHILPDSYVINYA